MAKQNQATRAKKNRRKFAQFWKRIKSTVKRTASGIRKGVKAAAELPGKAQRGIEKWSADVSRAVHGGSAAQRAQKRARERERKGYPKPGLESDTLRLKELSSKVKRGEKLTKTERGQAEAIAKYYAEKYYAELEQKSSAVKTKADRKAAARAEDKKRVEQSPGFRGWAEDGKPIMEWTDWVKADPQQQRKARDAHDRLEQKPKPDRAAAARAAAKSVPKTITVPKHDRKGTKGVTQHQRKTTAKEQNQMAAQKLMEQDNAKTLLQKQDRAIDAFKAAPNSRYRAATGEDIRARIPKVNEAMEKISKKQ